MKHEKINIIRSIKIEADFDETIKREDAEKEAVKHVLAEENSNVKYNGRQNGVLIHGVYEYEEKADKNPFRIPDLNPMYQSVQEYVKNNQGKKGYIDTQNSDTDDIYCYIYIDPEFEARERRIHAIRVNPKDNELEILFDKDVNGLHKDIFFSEEDIKAKEREWLPVHDENVYFIPAIFNIAQWLQYNHHAN